MASEDDELICAVCDDEVDELCVDCGLCEDCCECEEGFAFIDADDDEAEDESDDEEVSEEEDDTK